MTPGNRTPRSRTGRSRKGRAAVGLARIAGLVTLAVCAAACGIRTTSVPVDAGAAPSRVPCEVSRKDVITQARPGVPVQIYLVCASGLAPVERAARIPEEKALDGRIQIAQALLDELQAEPSAAERQAGFSTSVRGPLILSSPRKGDPPGTLRLSRPPEDLPAAALAQIVCTFAESEATDGKVTLGGPGDYAPHVYGCTQEAKSRPDSAVPTLSPIHPSSS